MKFLSVDPELNQFHDVDVAYARDVLMHATVFLDGQEVEGCFTADAEQGYIDRYAPPHEGKAVLTGIERRHVVQRLFGEVRIQITENP